MNPDYDPGTPDQEIVANHSIERGGHVYTLHTRANGYVKIFRGGWMIAHVVNIDNALQVIWLDSGHGEPIGIEDLEVVDA